MCGWVVSQSSMAMCIFCNTSINIVPGAKLGISPMNLGLMCLSLCGCRKRPPQRKNKRIMVFVANCAIDYCVSTVQVRYLCGAVATAHVYILYVIAQL